MIFALHAAFGTQLLLHTRPARRCCRSTCPDYVWGGHTQCYTRSRTAGVQQRHGAESGDAEANVSERDNEGSIYLRMPEDNAIYYHYPHDLQIHGFMAGWTIIRPPVPQLGQMDVCA